MWAFKLKFIKINTKKSNKQVIEVRITMPETAMNNFVYHAVAI